MFKILKKAVSGALAGLMLVSVLPVSVSADEATVYFSKDFKSAADIGNDAVRTWNGNCGYGFDTDLDAARFTGKWAEGVTQTGNVYVSPSGLTAATGKIYADYRFRIDNDATETGYIPLSFESASSWDHINKGTVPLFIQNGKIYVTSKGNATSTDVKYDKVNGNFYNAAVQEVCNITKDTWYTVKLYIDMDSDSSTFINYNIYIKDESTNKEYRGKNLQLGLPHTLWSPGKYDITQIGSYSYGYIYANLDYSTHDGGTKNAQVDTAYNLYMDYINVRQAQDGDETIFDEPDPTPEPSDDKYLQIDFDSSYSGDKFLSSGAADGVNYTDNNNGTFTFKYAGGRGKAYIRKLDSTITGSIYSEARFKYAGTNIEIIYEPLSPAQLEEKSLTSAAKTVFIKGNKFYAASKYAGKTTTASESISETNWDNSMEELCSAVPNKWYKLQMRTNVTEDTNSFNTYEVCITDEESGTRYIKKDLYFGLPSVCWNPTSYNMNGIGEFKYGAVGHTAYAGATAEDSTLTMDYVMARKATSDDDAAFTETTPDPDPSDDKYFINEDFENFDKDASKWNFKNTNKCNIVTDGENKYYSVSREQGDSTNPPLFYYKTSYGKSGNVVVEGDFKINGDTTGRDSDPQGVYPIYLTGNGVADNAHEAIRTVYVKNGKLYAVSDLKSSTSNGTMGNKNATEICAIDSDKWYNIKVVLNVDGDTTTVDTFTYQVTDKKSNQSYTGGPYSLGYVTNIWKSTKFDIDKIDLIGFGMTFDNGAINEKCDIDNIKVYEAEALTVTSSVENGAADVEPGAVDLTFNYAIAADSVSQITLYEKKNGSWTSVSASKTLDSTGKIATITADTMKYGKEYKIVVPTTVSAVTGEALKAEVEITFTTKEMPKVLEVSNVKFNGNTSLAQLTPGDSVKVTADFKNTGLNNNQPATLIVAAYNNDGTMVAVAYMRKPIALNATGSLDASITLPTAEGKQAAQIKVFAWDDFESMQEMSDVVIMPQ